MDTNFCPQVLLLLLCLNAAKSEYNISIFITPTEGPSPSCPIQTIQCTTLLRYTNYSAFPCGKSSNFIISDFVDDLNTGNHLSCEDVSDNPCMSGMPETRRCGACPTNYSLVLGSSTCSQCSNIYLLLLLPFAVAGPLLLIFLLICNLTVSNGHINGIIFFANIVHVNEAIFFQTQNIPYQIFSVFISWLNLDFGIETCFYNGMDAYEKVWLHFVFPAYLWILIFLMLILTKYSKTAAKCVFGNSVADLAATIFILSYTKIVRIVIAAMSFGSVEEEDGSVVRVWLMDGNVEYFSPKHTALFTVALLFAIVYIIPLTLLVFFAPLLQAKSHLKALRWVRKIKPYLDAYNVPYNSKFHHWTGLLLIVRVILFIVFAANFKHDRYLAYFLIVTIIGPLALFVLVKRNHTVHRNKFAGIVETASLLNIVILSIINWLLKTTSYRHAYYITEYVTYASVGITMFMFVVVLVYQIMLQFCPQIFIRSKKSSTDLNTNEHELEETMTTSQISCPAMELSQAEDLKMPLLETKLEESTCTKK